MPGKRYIKAPDQVLRMLSEAICRFECYQPLCDAGVRIDVLMAYAPTDDAGAPTASAIEVNGYPAAACIKVQKLDHRALGLGDALMTIDAAWWTKEGRTDGQRMALLDHELNHLEVVLDDAGTVVDTSKRPKLSLRKHDVQFGWFRDVAMRNGEDAVEVMQAKALIEGDAQTFWPQLLKEAAAARGTRHAQTPV